MKQAILLIICLLVWSCASDDPNPNELLGEWRLEATATSNGSDVGTFIEVESAKSITFLKNGSVTTVGSFCSADVNNSEVGAGNYSVTDSIIRFDCDTNGLSFRYEISSPDTLIIHVPFCRESCRLKFTRGSGGQ